MQGYKKKVSLKAERSYFSNQDLRIEASTWVGMMEGEEEGNETFYGKVSAHI